MHHIATGLFQLHSAAVAHQDLKPSNVLVFDHSISKVADLGSASVKGKVNVHETGSNLLVIVPTLLLSCYTATVTLSGVRDAKLVTFFYHLGSMVVFFFVASE